MTTVNPPANNGGACADDCPTCATFEVGIEFEDTACPACGDPTDYCTGHGAMTDPLGWAILSRHDQGDHTDCIFPEECVS